MQTLTPQTQNNVTKKKSKWNKAELDIIQEYYPVVSCEEVANKLRKVNPYVTRTAHSIKAKAKRMGIKKIYLDRWSAKEIDLILYYVKDIPITELGDKLRKFEKKNQLKLKTNEQIINKLNKMHVSYKVEESSVYVTTNDISTLLGCNRHQAKYIIISNKTTLRPKVEGGVYLIKREKFKTFLFENQSLLEYYQHTLNLRYLLSIIKDF